MLAAFNIDLETPAKKTIALERLGLDPAKTYLAYNFWEQRFLGGVRKEITLNLPPSSGTLLAIHEKRDEPQFLSTDRHVMQGAIELEAAAWDASSGAFSGISLGPKGTEHNVFIHLPHEHEWVQKEPFFFHDREGITLKMMEPHILRVQARFENSKRVAWNASLRDLFPDTY